jgi:hypothetical protein
VFADGVAGEWNFSMSGPTGEVPALLTLKQAGTTVTGTFDFSGRKLTVEGGKFEDGQLSMTVKRDRPSGGNAVYQMTAKLAGDTLEGTTSTDFMGNPATSPWKATRKK